MCIRDSVDGAFVFVVEELLENSEGCWEVVLPNNPEDPTPAEFVLFPNKPPAGWEELLLLFPKSPELKLVEFELVVFGLNDGSWLFVFPNKPPPCCCEGLFAPKSELPGVDVLLSWPLFWNKVLVCGVPVVAELLFPNKFKPAWDCLFIINPDGLPGLGVETVFKPKEFPVGALGLDCLLYTSRCV